MKKLLFVLLLIIACIGCGPVYKNQSGENVIYGWNYIDNSNKYRLVNIDGHDYIVFSNKRGYSGGISVIHSESCKCKQKKK